MAEIKDLNLASAKLAAAAKYALIERLAMEGQVAEDPDVLRKIVDTLDKVSVGQEPKQQVQVWAPLQFSIVLDPNAAQEAPARRMVLVDEVVDVEPQEEPGEPMPATPPELPAPDEPPAPLSLDDLADLLGVRK